jgi:PAS domain S-box-containing protein
MDQNRRILLSGIGLLLVVILVLATATRLFFKSLLGKLLQRLDTIANAYSTGTYNPSRHDMPFHEFQPLLRILSDMRDNLNAQYVEIRNAEKKYRSIFENAVEGIFQTTPAGRVVSANPAMAHMLGYESSGDLESAVTDIGKQVYFEPEHREAFIRQLKAVSEVSGFQTRMKRKDGTVVWLAPKC